MNLKCPAQSMLLEVIDSVKELENMLSTLYPETNIKSIRESRGILRKIPTLAHQVIDVNGAIFYAFNDFRSCIPEVQKMLRRIGLLETNIMLDPSETLSLGQLEEIDSVWNTYPYLKDDAFVARYRDAWLEDKCIGSKYRVLSSEELFKPIYALQ